MPHHSAARNPAQRPSVGAPPKSRTRKYATAPLGTFTWERQAGESPEAYARFLAYRNTPLGQRSMRKVGVCPSLAFRWAKQHQWSKRVAAYDDWTLSMAEQLGTDKAIEMLAEHAAFGREAMRKAKDAIAAMPAKRLKPAEAVNMARAGIEIEREARGLPTGDEREYGGSTVNVVLGMPSAYERVLDTSPLPDDGSQTQLFPSMPSKGLKQ